MNPCPKCGEPLEDGAAFCEACGTKVGEAPAAAPDAVPVAEQDAPISAVTVPRRPAAPVTEEIPARRPCLSCGGEVGPDGYCDQCGAKAPSERDHFREQPAAWVAGVCDRGIRHLENEDAMALVASPTPGERAVLVVMDGVSNTEGSSEASLAGARAAREVLTQPFPAGMGTDGSRLAAATAVYTDAVARANEVVVSHTPDGSDRPPSATFVSVVVQGNWLCYANIGDSRSYWLPDDGEGVQLSVDDSAAQELIAAGMDRQQAETGPHGHAITRWLGQDAPDVTPRVGELTVDRPGWVLACSDGLWNYASEPAQIAEKVRAAGSSDPAAIALSLVEFANACGGQDNITAALARVEPTPGQNVAPAPPPSDQEESRG